MPTLCSQLYADSMEGKARVGHQKYGMDSIWELPEAQWRNPKLKILLPPKLPATECSLYLVPNLCNQRFCPGLSLHQPVPSLYARQGSYTCTANHTKFSELETGWSGKPAFTRGWTTHQPTAHKVTYLSGYIFQMQMCPPQPACSTSAFYSWSQPSRCLLAVFLIISSFHSGPRSELTQ